MAQTWIVTVYESGKQQEGSDCIASNFRLAFELVAEVVNSGREERVVVVAPPKADFQSLTVLQDLGAVVSTRNSEAMAHLRQHKEAQRRANRKRRRH